MMGGTEAIKIAEEKETLRQYSLYKCIFVETESMKKVLNDNGLAAVKVFPNCRKRVHALPAISYNTNKMKCVFFSNIQKQKGVDIVLDVAKRMENIEFYLYGYIEREYEEEFGRQIFGCKNLFYKGFFSGTNEETIEELSCYDVLLFPTRYKTEGVPGVLVEAKIAGLVEVVTDISYNSELVINGMEGIVIKEPNIDLLEKAIDALDSDRQLLYDLKCGSRASAERFYIDKYMDDIITYLN